MSFNPEIKTITHITLKSVRDYIGDDEVGYILHENICESEDTIGVNYATIMTIPNFINVMKYTMKWNCNDVDPEVKTNMKDIITRLKQEDAETVFVWVGPK